ncbi:MAG: AMIN domain-containing protein, partial [Thermoanaerobaculaceae bacterium]|nr:AMIN domain-containing protein [Thermoanaerobaculaceae bacterium]
MMATGKRWKVAVVAIAAVAALGFAGTTQGSETVSVLGMAWTEAPASALVVSATGPLVFSESRPAPGVVQVDIAHAVVTGEAPPVRNPSVGLRSATLAEIREGETVFTRLTIELAAGAEAAVSALPAGLEVRFSGLSPSPPRGEVVSDLLAVADEGGVSVVLASGAPLVGKTFTLADPPRVVLDLPGVVNQVKRRVHPVEAAGIQRVRIAQFATEPAPVVRVVVDLERPLPYDFTTLETGAVLRVGTKATHSESAEVATATAQQAPDATPPAREAVAEVAPPAP